MPWFRPSVRRTPTLLQMEAVECGAAALGIVLAAHGRHVSLAELRIECGVSRDGSNAANVLKAARRYGMRASGVSSRMGDVEKLPAPFIVFWHFNHFLVVEGFVGDRVFLNDPATGRRTVSLAEFDEGFTGVVLQLEPGPGFERGGRPPSAARALWSRLAGSRRDLLYAVGAGLLLVVPGIAVPMLTQLFVDAVLIEGRSDWVRPLLVGLLALGVLQLALAALQLRALRRWRTKLAISLSGTFLWHVLHLPVGFFAQRYAGEIGTRTQLNGRIADAMTGPLARAAIDSSMVLAYAAVMFYYDVALTLIGLAFAFGNVVALQVVARRRVDASVRLQQDQGKADGVSIAGLQSIETLKASALESSFFTRWAGYYTKAAEARQNLRLSSQALAVLPELLAALSTLLILVVGGWRVIAGELTIGMLIAFRGLMQRLQGPVATLVGLGDMTQKLHGDLRRVDDVLDHGLDPAVTDPDDGGPRGTLAGALELRDVTFGYSRVAPPLLERLRLRLRPGGRVALVGGSGSGKSTVAKLVCGLYQPWDGEIVLDGRPRSAWSRVVLADSIGFVDQDIVFFGGTVRQNLTLWDETIPQDWIESACRDAAIHDAIQALPGGYDAELLEGASNLSGGQRQRLEIARALVHNPSLLVLDEATSALDSDTERVIDDNLRRRGCAVLVVAHRLSTVRDADEIVVLRRGQVVERGRHEELWEAGGEYARLIRSAGGALE